MDFMGGISTVISVISFTLFAAGVAKIFQMATLLSEIKDLLSAIKHNGPIHGQMGAQMVAPGMAAASLPLAQSGEEMLRALSMELDHPIPAVTDLEHKS
jgi:hypothetical protein